MLSKVIGWLGVALIAVVGAVLAFELLMVVFLVALQRSVAFREWVRHFNKQRLNPVVLATAGRVNSPYAVMHHVGRRSGRHYTTPVRVRPTPVGFIVPLPYGRDVDWCRNILAAGGAVITWQGQDYAVAAPEVLSTAAAATRLPLSGWRTWLWTSLVPRSPLGEIRCVWVRRRSPVTEPVKSEPVKSEQVKTESGILAENMRRS